MTHSGFKTPTWALCGRLVWAALAGLAPPSATAAVSPLDPAQSEFFESRIRPILSDHCYRCHSNRAEKLKGGLRLDDRDALLKGGDNGPAVVPGHPERSRLIEAVAYGNPDLQMPPKTRLPPQQVADLREWVEMGAAYPTPTASTAPSGAVPAAGPAFDLQARRAAHWAWQPIVRHASPAVARGDWPLGDIDRFILAKLEEKGLQPAPAADRRTLIRRASFVLTGLPPTPEEVEVFVRDDAPNAYEKVIDRLLASPHFGERWARHWMDLVRYSDTLGNESDAVIPNAWRYRDYLIRAFNADVPYDQFLTEHLAGDLLERPRLDPAAGMNESVVATAFLWMNEGKRSPVDVRQAQADCFDNKIDVLCKTFLGMTVACARCHDHKFDPITQRDYYGLYGYLKSSRYTQALLNRKDWDAGAAELESLRTRLRETATDALSHRASDIGRCLLATAGGGADGLPADRAARWSAALRASMDAGHPMYPWAKVAELGPGATKESVAARWREVVEQVKRHVDASAEARHREGDVELADFNATGYRGWFPEDQAFGPGPCRPGDFLPGNSPQRPIQTLFRNGAWAHSGYVSRSLQGTLRSRNFTTERRYLHVFAAGRAARINVNVEQFVMIQSPLYGELRWALNSDGPRWHTFDLNTWPGRSFYLECADTTTADLHDKSPWGADGYVALGRAVLSDRREPPPAPDPDAGTIVTDGPAIESLPALADAYQLVATESLSALRKAELTNSPQAEGRASFLSWLIENGLLDLAPNDPATPGLADLFKQYRDAEARLPDPARAPATIDGPAEDEYVFIRGSHKTAGPLVPRRIPEAIGGAAQPPAPSTGSGRLDLARRLLAPSDPLVARVMVNRVWHHVFGRGIVASVDNFGALGDAPTHPELLDDLAARFIEQHWSVKKLIREMVLSRAFQMSSSAEGPTEAAERAEKLDPDNRLLHRMPVRRLEGEAIRDAVLQLSGRLDPRLFGPGVEVYLTPEMQAYTAEYGKPAKSGPLDGDGRRSVYLMVRRNFLSPFLCAFDTPPPLNTVGRRNVSNVPAQALAMMNDPFIAEQAKAWANSVLAAHPGTTDPAARIRRMYLEAFSRPPTQGEMEDVLAFLDEHGKELGVPRERRDSAPQLWADLAHALMNVKEFIFVN